ncbi:helix-turn-helix domain-containing protein [Novosphingobium sp. SL115]|uniref:helix-turn-helix domain-containing protein n=1 Tax=Novosphingobium sp. SL115 TaxID=2995150 RepID=UPI00227607CE|nr:helix-turn-helix domain-containing protein [Novosphingobium sp. SL115]MCY1670903.1 helix-turn-helix domain-containing protein [Novosphingobium sp. SL115]
MSRYFTTFYLTEITVPDGGKVADHLHPEWANLRICSGDLPVSELPGMPVGRDMTAIVTGPTSVPVRFTVGSTRIWGVGFLPLGWARYVRAPARSHADKFYDVAQERFLVPFRALAERLFAAVPDEQAELQRIVAHFMAGLDMPPDDDPRIVACHTALLNADIGSVAEMAEASGVPQHTLERLCARNFGFPPRLLLRRQRFMRSLVQYMLDPSLHWIGAIDGHYHDQAQFVRDFHRFMGMSPSEYAASPKPVLQAVMRARQEFVGSAVQALHAPTAS